MGRNCTSGRSWSRSSCSPSAREVDLRRYPASRPPERPRERWLELRRPRGRLPDRGRILDRRRSAIPTETRREGIWATIRATKDPSLLAILFEDSAALLRLLVAALGISPGPHLNNPYLD